ncbi:unnamed protein product [Protopolystoma xenopodis]|uniref:Uncharacterized protein n=1 Tax=Protopolystoma xenopodis TaxID=117903 RepID=A0A3S5BLH8_9PLAT|nr:unnamed protein product [Protopolystoma xenopodis]
MFSKSYSQGAPNENFKPISLEDCHSGTQYSPAQTSTFTDNPNFAAKICIRSSEISDSSSRSCHQNGLATTSFPGQLASSITLVGISVSKKEAVHKAFCKAGSTYRELRGHPVHLSQTRSASDLQRWSSQHNFRRSRQQILQPNERRHTSQSKFQRTPASGVVTRWSDSSSSTCTVTPFIGCCSTETRDGSRRSLSESFLASASEDPTDVHFVEPATPLPSFLPCIFPTSLKLDQHPPISVDSFSSSSFCSSSKELPSSSQSPSDLFPKKNNSEVYFFSLCEDEHHTDSIVLQQQEADVGLRAPENAPVEVHQQHSRKRLMDKPDPEAVALDAEVEAALHVNGRIGLTRPEPASNGSEYDLITLDSDMVGHNSLLMAPFPPPPTSVPSHTARMSMSLSSTATTLETTKSAFSSTGSCNNSSSCCLCSSSQQLMHHPLRHYQHHCPSHHFYWSGSRASSLLPQTPSLCPEIPTQCPESAQLTVATSESADSVSKRSRRRQRQFAIVPSCSINSAMDALAASEKEETGEQNGEEEEDAEAPPTPVGKACILEEPSLTVKTDSQHLCYSPRHSPRFFRPLDRPILKEEASCQPLGEGEFAFFPLKIIKLNLLNSSCDIVWFLLTSYHNNNNNIVLLLLLKVVCQNYYMRER